MIGVNKSAYSERTLTLGTDYMKAMTFPDAWTQLSAAFKSEMRFISLKAPPELRCVISFVSGDAFCICHLFNHYSSAGTASELSTVVTANEFWAVSEIKAAGL